MMYELRKIETFKNDGTIETYWGVICLTHISKNGIIREGKVLKKGSLIQCNKYIKENDIILNRNYITIR